MDMCIVCSLNLYYFKQHQSFGTMIELNFIVEKSMKNQPFDI